MSDRSPLESPPGSKPARSDGLHIELARFRPRLLDSLKDYDRARFITDVTAGMTVGVIALPLAMAFAIASGVKPEQGLLTAILGGFLISALGGSNVQIGGPAGAFIVIVYGIVERYGLANLLIATSMAGVLLFLMGWLKLGALVRYIPVSIVIGFTNGIAVLIGLSQLKDLLGLPIAKMPGDFFSQIALLWAHLHGFNPAAFGVGLACLATVVLWPKSYTMPVSMTFPSDGTFINGTLAAIVAEVNNTFGERHCYLLDAPRYGQELRADKVFHVSPFCHIEGGYRFRFMRAWRDGQEKTVARIDHDDATGPLLQTSVAGTLTPVTPVSLRKAFWGYPAMTFGVLARIHWQAFKLWRKHVPFISKPKPPALFVTR